MSARPREAALRQRLILTVPPATNGPALAQMLAAGDVAAVVIAPDAPGRDSQIAAAQGAGAAALLAAPDEATSPLDVAGEGDGVHLGPPHAGLVAALRQRVDVGSVGLVATTKHEAMTAGEAGVDYVWFDMEHPATPADRALELAAWWADVFEIAGVAAGPVDAAEALAATGAEFIAPSGVFGAPDPAALVAELNDLLDRTQTAE